MPEFSESSVEPVPKAQKLRVAGQYLRRALRWKCPECGQSPIFCPVSKIRSLSDWFTPLDGCPKCGYPYEREIGYFLMSIWAVGYGFAVVVGSIIYLIEEYELHYSLKTICWTVIPIVFIVNLLFVRHSKALWLAVDHYFDPHKPASENPGDSDSGGGNKPNAPKSPAPEVPDKCTDAESRIRARELAHRH